MDGFDYDLFVIGGGSGGVRAARMSSQMGARVAVAESYRFGGTCVIRGCVPKKLLVYASSFGEAFHDAAGYGWTVPEPSFSWPSMVAAKEREITRLEAVYAGNLRKAGADIHHSRARIVDPHTVELTDDGRRFSAKHILVATGGQPFVPPFPGYEHAVTSDEMFDLPELPKRALVLGGGYIAAEFACILHGLGVAVTIVQRGARILRSFDEDLSDHVTAEMRKKGIEIRLSTGILGIERTPEGLVTALDDGGAVVSDLVLAATGRRPSTDGLGLEEAGVELDARGAVVVDDYSRSSVPSIWAIGDVTGRLELTPVAIREGAAFAETVFGGRPTRADHALVATAIFTQPEIGTVGMTEQEARTSALRYDVYRSSFRPLLHTLSGRDERALMKLIVNRADDRVLGVHVCGHGAGEMIQLAAVAMKMGATKADFDRTVAVHPTSAEELVTMREAVAIPQA